MDNALKAQGDINCGFDPEGDLLMDPVSESESDGGRGGVSDS